MEIIKNAIIESLEIGNEDHGLLSAWLRLDYGDGGASRVWGVCFILLRKNYSLNSIVSINEN